MIKTDSQVLTTINNQFKSFSDKALKGSKPNRAFVISYLQKYEKSYKREGFITTFVQKAQQLAEDFDKNGATDFTGIIYASLIKIKNLSSDICEAPQGLYRISLCLHPSFCRAHRHEKR